MSTSAATKKKHVRAELDELSLPDAGLGQEIAKVCENPGTQLFKVLTSSHIKQNQDPYLASLPKKFRHTVYIKRGNFVYIEPIPDGDKVKAEIVKILTDDHIKWLKKQDHWPVEFDDKPKPAARSNSADEDETSDSGNSYLDGLDGPLNNRQAYFVYEEESSDESESD